VRLNGKRVSLGFVSLSLLLVALPRAHADVAVLLEEPYSYDGALAGTGHTAVYLTRVCAASPVTLRRCDPGEHGVVISRYARIGGFDWIAIPLIPYLYAVEKPEDIPLYADAKLVALLRDRYRRYHLEEIAPDAPGGQTPKGDWVQLIGSSYDRTNYVFQIETTPEQDDALIAWLNSRPNHASFKVVTRNCANFVSDVLNFYYPHSESRASIADLGVHTPKHEAKSLVRYGRHHANLEFAHFVIPQVPGAMKRSRPVRGVVESFFRAKKYVAALALFHPFVAGGVAAAYLVGDRFDPARDTLVFSLNGAPEAPPSGEEKESYLNDLEAAEASNKENAASGGGSTWRKFEQGAQPRFREDGGPAFQAPYRNGVIEVGVARGALSDSDAPAELRQGLMISKKSRTQSRWMPPGVRTLGNGP